jgi:hypothetical protein
MATPAKPPGPCVRIYGRPKGSTQKKWTLYVSLGRGKPAKATGFSLDALVERMRRHYEQELEKLPPA